MKLKTTFLLLILLIIHFSVGRRLKRSATVHLSLVEEIYDGNQSTVYTATVDGSKQEFVLKLLKTEDNPVQSKEYKMIQTICDLSQKPTVIVQDARDKSNQPIILTDPTTKGHKHDTTCKYKTNIIDIFNKIDRKCITTTFFAVGNIDKHPFFVMKKYK